MGQPPPKHVQRRLRNRELRPEMRPKVSDSLRVVLREHFNRMDSEGKGRIDAHDLRRGLAQLGIQLELKDVLELIHTTDTNLSGTLEYAEFEDLWAMHMISTSPLVWLASWQLQSSRSLSALALSHLRTL